MKRSVSVLPMAPVSETDRSLVPVSVLPMAPVSETDCSLVPVSVLPMAAGSQKDSQFGISQAEPAAVILSVPDLVPVLVPSLSFRYSDCRYHVSPLFLR